MSMENTFIKLNSVQIEVKLIMKFLYRGYVLLFNSRSDQIVNLSFALKK